MQAGPKRRALYLELDDLLRVSGLDDRAVAARPIAPPALLPLHEAHGNAVQVLGYRPEFQAERNKWFVDVAIDPGTAVRPFVRLAVARYQPDSLANCHLSPVVHCVFTQLSLERTATLSRPDMHHARLVVSGPVGFRAPLETVAKRTSADPAAIAEFIRDNRRFLARLERRDPAIPTDLAWRSEVITELAVVGFDPTDGEFAWMGMLELPESIDPARPGAADDWRITVEEWEALEADPVPFHGDNQTAQLTKEWRIVYADHRSCRGQHRPRGQGPSRRWTTDTRIRHGHICFHLNNGLGERRSDVIEDWRVLRLNGRFAPEAAGREAFGQNLGPHPKRKTFLPASDARRAIAIEVLRLF